MILKNDIILFLTQRSLKMDLVDRIEATSKLLNSIKEHFSNESIDTVEMKIMMHALVSVAARHYTVLTNNPTPAVLKRLIRKTYAIDDPHGGINKLYTYLEELSTIPPKNHALSSYMM